jgi:cytochrome b subunit of formate dehydrogenase
MNTSATMLRRFTGVQRLFHLGLVVTFMLLSVTGLAWMFIETPWGAGLVDLFGGYPRVLLIHRITGLVMLAGLAVHVVYLLALLDWRHPLRSLLSPDALVYHWRDVVDFFRQLRWVVLGGAAPRFERWGWWEKFDYWAVWWGLVIVGSTGLLVYDPVLSADYVPGWFYNIAVWIHRIEALLAMGHIFTVHFFLENFRPANFPFNAAMFDGGIPLKHALEEHPQWVERLQREGNLEARVMSRPLLGMRLLHFAFGYSIIALGLFLLAGFLAYAGLLTFTPSLLG